MNSSNLVENSLMIIFILSSLSWLVLSFKALRDSFYVFRFFREGRTGFKSYILFQMAYHFGALALGVAILSSILVFREKILASPLLVICTLALGVSTFIADYLYRKAISDSAGVPDLMMMKQYFIYLSGLKAKKTAAEKASPLVPSKYLENVTLKTRVLLPTVKYMKDVLGEEGTEEIFNHLGVPLDYIYYHESDINIEFSNDLYTLLMKKLDRKTDVVFEAQSRGANLECMGAMFFFVSKLFSVIQIYRVICRISRYLDANFANEVLESDDDWMVMRCRFKDQRLLSRFNETVVFSVGGWISSIPNLKGLPHAKVEVLNSPFAESKESDKYLQFKVSWVNQLSDSAEINKMIYDSIDNKKG